MGNSVDYLDKMPPGTKIESIEWNYQLKISHKMIERFSKGNVYFGGDNAHQHNPFGYRGINLGIEDAYVFAKLYSQDSLKQYNESRSTAISPVIERIAKMTDIIRGKSKMSQFYRNLAPFVASKVNKVASIRASQFALGLDHDV